MDLEFAISTAQPAPVGCVADRSEALRPTGSPVYLRPQWGDVVAEWACPVCGTSCNRTYHSGRSRVYCTNACRQRAYRLRRRSLVPAPATAAPVRARTRDGLHALRSDGDLVAGRRDSTGRQVTACGSFAALHAGSPVVRLAHGFHRRRAVVLPNVCRRAARRADPSGHDARTGPAVRRGAQGSPLNIHPVQRAYSARMASNKQHLETLRSVALFSACSNKELEKVARAADEIKMTAGTLIVDQGQTGREAFVVVAGEVSVKRNNRKIATLGPGAVVGELSLLDHGPRTATAICETDCTLLVIDQRRFLGVIDDVPAISHKLLASLASKIRELDRQYYG